LTAQGLSFQKIARVITAVDCQPTFDGGVLINVLGQLKVWKYIGFAAISHLYYFPFIYNLLYFSLS